MKTNTRKVRQNYRIFSNEEKRKIINMIDNRHPSIGFMRSCELNEIGNSQYYVWKKKLGSQTPVSKKSSIRKFSDVSKRTIIDQIDNRPGNVKKTAMFRKFGLGKGKLYYDWKKELGMSSVSTNHPMESKMNVPMNVKTDGKKLHTVTLSVEVGSLMELIGFCNDIVKTPKVKSVLSVE